MASLIDELSSRFREQSSTYAIATLGDRSTAARNTPEPRFCSLETLLVEASDPRGIEVARELREGLNHARAMIDAPACPILAVVGMLNAGKSSLVAGFLDDGRESGGGNRSRVLIGSANTEGTHRFVLWVPSAWQANASIWKSIQERLKSVFGHEPEVLSEDGSIAATQYNDMQERVVVDQSGNSARCSPIEIPLIATDFRLNELGVALMDCPDVQTGAMSRFVRSDSQTMELAFSEQSQAIAESRLAVLSRASSICSAFIVVLPANAMHDQTVRKMLTVLRERMPQVQRMLAVNRVPRKYDVETIAHEVNHLYASDGLSRVYMAYHFDGPHQRDRIPEPPKQHRIPAGTPLPLFFRIDDANSTQPPEPIAENSWLFHIGNQLQPTHLLSDSWRSIVGRLNRTFRAAIEIAREEQVSRQKRAHQIRQAIAQACVDFSIDPNSNPLHPTLRLQVSRQIIEQISQSLERTAPWWARPGRWVQRVAESSKTGIRQATHWLHVPKWFTSGTSNIGDWIRSRFKQGQSGRVVTATTLVEYLAQRDRAGHLRLDNDDNARERVREAVQRAIDRFQQESETELDSAQLDQLTRRMWSEMPMSRRLVTGIAPAGVLFAPLVAVLMLPLDFGGTTVLFAASLKELFFAGAASVGLMLATSDQMPHLAESEAAWKQLGDLNALLGDELGLGRQADDALSEVKLGTQSRAMSPSTLAQHVTTTTPFVQEIIDIDATAVKRLTELLDTLERTPIR